MVNKRIYVAQLLPPPLSISARLMPQYMHWQIGRYREILRSGPGGIGRGAVWFAEREGEQHNLILNQTYDSLMAQYGVTPLTSYAAVGTGSTAPSPTQTGLVNEVVRTNFAPTADQTTQVSNGLFEYTRSREFTEAQVGGRNLTEWGFSPVSSAGNNLAVRELFRDGGGNPITLTIDPDQRLRLNYKYRLQVSPTVAVNNTINITGLGARTGKVVHTMATGSGGNFPPLVVTELAMTGNLIDSGGNLRPDFQNVYAHSVAGATIYTDTTTTATGVLGYKWPGVAAYTAGSRTRQVNAVTFLNTEAVGTIRTIGLGSIYLGCFRFVLDPGQEIIKDNLNKLTIGVWTVTWGP